MLLVLTLLCWLLKPRPFGQWEQAVRLYQPRQSPSTQLKLFHLCLAGFPERHVAHGVWPPTGPRFDLAWVALRTAVEARHGPAVLELLSLYQNGLRALGYRPHLELASRWMAAISTQDEFADIRTSAQDWIPGTWDPMDLQGLSDLPRLEPPSQPAQRHWQIFNETDLGADLIPDITLRPREVQPAHLALQPTRLAYRAGSDSQNVHDSGIQNGLAKFVKDLAGRYPMSSRSVSDALREVRQQVNSAPLEVATRAEQVLDRIESSVGTMVKTGLSEADTLALVWHHAQRFEAAPQLRENIVTQLAESIEHGQPVCTTGRMTRLAAAFEGIDPNINLLSDGAIQQLILSHLSVVVPDLVEKNVSINAIVDQCELWTRNTFPNSRLVDQVKGWVEAAV